MKNSFHNCFSNCVHTNNKGIAIYIKNVKKHIRYSLLSKPNEYDRTQSQYLRSGISGIYVQKFSPVWGSGVSPVISICASRNLWRVTLLGKP